jgi:hypothetical protein
VDLVAYTGLSGIVLLLSGHQARGLAKRRRRLGERQLAQTIA